MSRKLIIKSNPATLANVLIRDLGFDVTFGGASPFVELLDTEEIAEASASEDLRTLTTDDAFGVNSSTLILNNGVDDIPQGDIDAFLAGIETEPLHNFDASGPPQLTDDQDKGYSSGSQWIDKSQVPPDIYMCVGAASGAAEWQAIGGGMAASGNEEALTIDFAFGDVSPKIVGILNPGDIVINSELDIITPFNDPAASLALGTIAVPGRFLGTNESQPDVGGNYVNQSNFPMTVAEQCRLTISPGTSTQGIGRVVVTVRRA